MTLEQLHSLSEDELGMALFIVNHISPVPAMKEIPPIGLTWFRKGTLEKKLMNALDYVNPEAHPIFSSLLTKLNIQHEIKYEQLPSGSLTP